MEIHELNTFSGTPGAGDYLATDNGTDTSKISIKAIIDPLNERIDNIIAGPASSAQEVIDARLGADGVTYTSLGEAIRTQISDIKNALSAENSIVLTNASLTVSGYYLSTSNGVPTLRPNSGFSSSDFIDISKVAKIVAFRCSTIAAGAYGMQFFTSAEMTLASYLGGESLSGTATATEVNIPTGAKYIRVCGRNTDSLLVVCVGSSIDLEARKKSVVLEDKIDENYINKASLFVTGRRKTLATALKKVTLPAWSLINDANLHLFSDGYKYGYICDLAKLKNTGSGSYYVSTQTEFTTALNNASSGDTIYLQDGTYLIPTAITKSLNLIGLGPKVQIVPVTLTPNWISTAMGGVYKLENVADIPIEAYQIAMDAPIKLTQVASTSDLAAEGTWRYVSTDQTLFVHLYGSSVPDQDVFVGRNRSASIPISNSSNTRIKIYLENLFVWGDNSAINANSNGANNIDVVAKDCKFWHSNLYNVVQLAAANGFFQNCDASYGYRDGFNYHSYTGANSPSNGIELDCIAHDNGEDATAEQYSNNGSTAHDGGLVIRVNGAYYRNYGGNVAETNEGTISYNYGCTVFDSRDEHNPIWNADFWCAQDAVQYVYGCIMDGDSNYGMSVVSDGATIYYDEYTSETETNGNVVPI